MKISNNFLKSIMDLDNDERITNGALIGQPKNISIFTTDGLNSAGVLKNCTGNVLKTDYNYAGAETIGSGKNESGEMIYNFIKANDYDYVIEYNKTTNTSTRVLQSATGGVLNFVSGERITNFDFFIDAETGFALIAWSGDSNPPRIVNVETAKTWLVNDFSNDEISLMKPSPIFAPKINVVTSTEGVENNFIEDKLLCFGTRYKYSDGFYSAPSSWSKPAFTPREFNLDYQTFENLGMLNLSNAVDIDFNVGARDVVQVDLLFRESNTTSIYVIEQFVKSEQGWGNNTTQTFQFSKAKIYTVLPEDQFFRNFDNVPLSARCQTAIGNRIAYANFIEGRNISENIDFDVTLVTEDPFREEIEGEIDTFIGATTYTNVINFSRGNSDGGPDIDQMNYIGDTVEMDLVAVGGGAVYATFRVEVTPKDSDLTKEYTVTYKEGATVLQQNTGLTGSTNVQYSSPGGVDKDVQIYVTSDDGLLYSCKLIYTPRNTLNDPILRYFYFCDYQLCLPKSGGYGATLVGNTIIDTIASFDMAGYIFKAGTQIRINITAQSSLVADWNPTATFFYNLTDNYTDLNDFLTNPTSGFVYQLETVFTQTFKNDPYYSGAGTFVSTTDFVVTQSSDNLLVQMPILVQNVTEKDGTVNKTEFYIIQDANLQTVNVNAFTSLHSNRDYEVGLIYLDEQGRKTTVLNAQNNTIYIPADNSELSNKLSVAINNNPPSWAKYYKFAIKQVKRDYETIYTNVVYSDGIYRWVQLTGESKNKVQAGDLLTLKSDYSGVLSQVTKVKVLEVGFKDSNFIVGNLKENGDEIIEESGFYMKIKQGNFDITVTQNAYQTYQDRKSGGLSVHTEPLFGFLDNSNTFVPTPVNSGSIITFTVNIQKGFLPVNTLKISKTVQEDYDNFEDWFTAEIATDTRFVAYVNDNVESWSFGAESQDFNLNPSGLAIIYTEVIFDANFSGGTLIFETEPIEQLNSSFFETPETFTISNGQHEFTDHLLADAYNCFAFGNGAESYKVRDSLNGKSFSIDSNPTDINKEGYKQLNRFADITYSEIYNSNTNVNRLNEFNLSLANYKDDIEKSWGPIFKMKGFDTNLDLIQEDKYSVVYYGKDLLFNADGTTNLTGVPQVLGQQNSLDGEFGCQNTDSFDFYGFNRYFVDVKRGSVLKKSNNGLFEISGQGMRSYFKTLFRDNTIDYIIGQYDQFYDVFMLNIKYNGDQYLTWIYSDSNNGWLGTQTFNPEDMIRLNGDFYTFKNGEIYLHNQEFNGSTPNYNIFYGESFESEASFNFSQDANTRKNYKTIELDGDSAWNVALETNYDKGNINVADFELKEGIFYGYIRYDNGVVDTSLLSYQGIGATTINGLTLDFAFNLDPIISVGDLVLNQNLQVVGTILDKTANSLIMDTVNNLSSGDFVLSSKPKSVQQNNLLGYYCRVTISLSKSERTELFSVSSEISKSFM